MILQELVNEVRRLSDTLDKQLAELSRQAENGAHNENVYRKAVATAWVAAGEGTVAEREAWVNGNTADLRLERDLAQAREKVALEAVRNARQQLSAIQSVLAANRAEAEFAKFGPTEGP